MSIFVECIDVLRGAGVHFSLPTGQRRNAKTTVSLSTMFSGRLFLGLL